MCLLSCNFKITCLDVDFEFLLEGGKADFTPMPVRSQQERVFKSAHMGHSTNLGSCGAAT